VKCKADTTNNGIDNIDDRGFGDIDFRLLTVPYINMKKKFALAMGLEVIIDTAEDSTLGGNSTSFGPQVFAVFFKPWGGALVEPAYQHVFSASGKDVNCTQLDVFHLYIFKKNFVNWFMINPQAVIDYESDKDSWNIDFEAGKMLTKNQSIYLRPGVGMGRERPFDFDAEIGWKLVW